MQHAHVHTQTQTHTSTLTDAHTHSLLLTHIHLHTPHLHRSKSEKQNSSKSAESTRPSPPSQPCPSDVERTGPCFISSDLGRCPHKGMDFSICSSLRLLSFRDCVRVCVNGARLLLWPRILSVWCVCRMWRLRPRGRSGAIVRDTRAAHTERGDN